MAKHMFFHAYTPFQGKLKWHPGTCRTQTCGPHLRQYDWQQLAGKRVLKVF